MYHHVLQLVLFFLFWALFISWGLDLRDCTPFSLLGQPECICRTRYFFLTVLCPQMQSRVLLINAIRKEGGKIIGEENV